MHRPEAEEMLLVSPARRFFDGYCNNFQCVRINAESETEKKMPGKVRGLAATVKGRQVTITWLESEAGDLHHYSVYCGSSPVFTCDNITLIRSVLKTSVTDAVPFNPAGLYYKVIAVDNRWNESEPATVKAE
jgi:hypothetical protein